MILTNDSIASLDSNIPTTSTPIIETNELSQEEYNSILNVIQKDQELRNLEKKRLE